MLKDLSEQLKNKNNLTINVKVTPKSQNNQIITCMLDEAGKFLLKIKIRGIPEKGQVNSELIKFLAETLDVAPSQIKITSGLSSRHKILHLHS